jgi:hypothetical protein
MVTKYESSLYSVGVSHYSQQPLPALPVPPLPPEEGNSLSSRWTRQQRPPGTTHFRLDPGDKSSMGKCGFCPESSADAQNQEADPVAKWQYGF